MMIHSLSKTERTIMGSFARHEKNGGHIKIDEVFYHEAHTMTWNKFISTVSTLIDKNKLERTGPDLVKIIHQ